jgi:hypothetical protein
MLTSERKVKKLFIKFLTWMKIDKAKNLLKQYPDIIFPWQKALIEAAGKNSFNSCRWIITTAITEYNTPLDIHFEDNILYKNASKYRYKDMLEILTTTEPDYDWQGIL